MCTSGVAKIVTARYPISFQDNGVAWWSFLVGSDPRPGNRTPVSGFRTTLSVDIAEAASQFNQSRFDELGAATPHGVRRESGPFPDFRVRQFDPSPRPLLRFEKDHLVELVGSFAEGLKFASGDERLRNRIEGRSPLRKDVRHISPPLARAAILLKPPIQVCFAESQCLRPCTSERHAV